MEQSESIKEITTALVECQKKLTAVKRDQSAKILTKSGSSYGYKYTSLDSIWEMCRQPLGDNGLAVIQSPELTEQTRVTIITMLAHTSGEWLRSSLTLEARDKDPQSIGSAITYARRYALSSLIGICSDEDDDAQDNRHREVGKKGDDIPTQGRPKQEHWCNEHKTDFFMRGKMKAFAHPVGDTGVWCHEHKSEAEGKQEFEEQVKQDIKELWPEDSQPTQKPIHSDPAERSLAAPQSTPKEEKQLFIDIPWLEDSLNTLQGIKKLKSWSNANILSYMKDCYKVEGPDPVDAARKLDKGQAAHFVKRVQEALEAS